MARRKRSKAGAEARQFNREQMSHVGSDLRASRLRRHLSQSALGLRAALSPSAVSDIERGWGGSYSLDALQLVARALGRIAIVKLSTDPMTDPADAGHLAIQELVLRMGRAGGFTRTFELPNMAASPSGWTDVGLRHPRRHLLALVECWNTIGDVGAAIRASDRKLAEAEQLAIAIGSLDEAGVVVPFRVRTCWVVRATVRNRALVARYPEIFATRFPGSSVGWVRALSGGAEPPAERGLVWCDVPARSLVAWRRRR